MEGHASGRLQGNVPADWMAEQGLGQCTVCSRLIALMFGNACPRCRSSLGAGDARAQGVPGEIPAAWPPFATLSYTHLPRPTHHPL